MKEAMLRTWAVPVAFRSCSEEERTYVLVLNPSCQHLHKDPHICHAPLRDSSPHLCLSGHWSTLTPPGDAENTHTEGDCLRGFGLIKGPSSARQQRNPPGSPFPSSLYLLRSAAVSPVALGGMFPFEDPFDGRQFLILLSSHLNKSENNLHQKTSFVSSSVYEEKSMRSGRAKLRR